MPDIQLGGQSLRTHGAKIARIHVHDWVVLILLAIVDGCLNLIEPFHRFVGRDMMTDLKYPLKKNTVPFWAVPVGMRLVSSGLECLLAFVHCGTVTSFFLADTRNSVTLLNYSRNFLQKEECF